MGSNNIAKIKSSWRKRIVIRNYYKTDFKKKALLVYIVSPFLEDNGFHHQNYLTARYIVEVLNEYRFDIDIIDCFNSSSRIAFDEYDLIIGFGAQFEQSFLAKTRAVKYFLVTGVHLELQNQNVVQALRVAKRRFGQYFYSDCHVVNEVNYFSHYLSDKVILLADGLVKTDFEERLGKKVSTLNNNYLGVWSNLGYKQQIKRDSFLVICGHGVLKKGLHLIIEFILTFPQFCYSIVYAGCSSEFRQEVLSQVIDMQNVAIFEGIPMNSPEFMNLIDAHGIIISPSYADGMPGAIIEPMLAGVIPLVSKYCGFPEHECFRFIEELTIEGIKKAVDDLLKLSDEELIALSRKVKDYATQNYDVEYCKSQLRMIMNDTL